jgi:catechol 2,3-dioxygenase-like lactoylglutathione lyase family enzyme
VEKFIDRLIKQFESGQIGRREFCQTLAMATAVFAGGAQANAAPAGRGFKMLGLNHLSYQCSDYKKARDFYSSMFGMQVLNDKGKGRANLAFGPEPGKGGNFLVVHNPGANPLKPSEAVIDHIAYTISNYDEGKVRAALKARGYDAPTGRDGSRHVYDPFDYDVQFASAAQENAFRREGR